MIVVLAPVVQMLDSAIHWINHYPLDNSIGFASVYPLDSDLSGGQRYPAFEQLGPGVDVLLCKLKVTNCAIIQDYLKKMLYTMSICTIHS